MARNPYPEHAKLDVIRDQSQKCGEFYEWLQTEKHIEMECHYEYELDEDGHKLWRDENGNIVEDFKDPFITLDLTPEQEETYRKMQLEQGVHCRLIQKNGGPVTMGIRQTVSQLLAEFFGIDEDKLEAEKVAMLDACRELHTEKKKKKKKG